MIPCRVKAPGALPLVVLPVLASALHLDQVLNQVQGASKALGDLVHKGDPVSYSQTTPLNRIAPLAIKSG